MGRRAEDRSEERREQKMRRMRKRRYKYPTINTDTYRMNERNRRME